MPPEPLDAQPRATALLGRALETGRIAHAYAFVGPAGSGRTTAALEFARALLCGGGRAPGSGRGPDPGATPLRRPCHRCEACRLVGERRHPDLHVIAPTPPAANPRGARAIRIDAIRELERQGTLRPVLGGRRVFVLDDAERMTGETPQAFLKFLEEPPPGTVVILVLPRARAVPATVISRCQLVPFRPRDDGRAAAAADELRGLVDAARSGGPAELFRRTERLDRDRAEALVDGAWLHCRERLLAGARVDEIDAALALCRRARQALLHNVSPRLTVEIVVSHLAFRAA
jgi:DNA polymerase-3 subunit delta'